MSTAERIARDERVKRLRGFLAVLLRTSPPPRLDVVRLAGDYELGIEYDADGDGITRRYTLTIREHPTQPHRAPEPVPGDA